MITIIRTIDWDKFGRGKAFPPEFIRTYAKAHNVGAIHELPLHCNKGFNVVLRDKNRKYKGGAKRRLYIFRYTTAIAFCDNAIYKA